MGSRCSRCSRCQDTRRNGLGKWLLNDPLLLRTHTYISLSQAQWRLKMLRPLVLVVRPQTKECLHSR
jgi:hypothetical protein